MIAVRDREKRIRLQQQRDERLRTERREAVHSHEASQQALRETAEHERTQARGEFDLAQQKIASRAGLQQTELQQTGETGRMHLQQAGETGRTGLRQIGETEQLATKEAGLGERQRVTIGAAKDIAEATDVRNVQQFHRDLGEKAFFAGQDPNVAAQLESSDRWSTKYQGLDPIKAASKKKSIRPTFYEGEMVFPGGARDEATGERTYDEDTASLKALIASLKKKDDEYKQGLR